MKGQVKRLRGVDPDAEHKVDCFKSVARRERQARFDAEELELPVLSIFSGGVRRVDSREVYLNLRPIEARLVLRRVLVKDVGEFAERRERKKANRADRRRRRGMWTSPTTRKESAR